jgi:hypothetical protein
MPGADMNYRLRHMLCTYHQERYNPLKLGDQRQESAAKVRPDFDVR